MKNNEIKNLFGAVEDISLAPMAEAPASAEAETIPVSPVRKTERDPKNDLEAFVSHRERRNGTERVVLRPHPVNRFDDESGAWRPLFGESTETEGGFEMALGGYAAKITKPRRGKKVSLGDGKHNISWEYVGKTPEGSTKTFDADGIEKKKPRVAFAKSKEEKAERFTYRNIDADTDLEYIFDECGIKENIIVKAKADEYRYFFTLHTDGLSVRMGEDDRTLELFAPATEDEPEKVHFSIPAPFVIDADGARSENVYYELEQKTPGKYLFAVVVDTAWMNDSHRAFPVTVDPQMIILDNVTFETIGDNVAVPMTLPPDLDSDPCAIPITNIELSSYSVTLVEGDSKMLDASFTPSYSAYAYPIWYSSDESVAMVVNGEIHAMKPGYTTVYVLSPDGCRSDDCCVTVLSRKHVTKISLPDDPIEVTFKDETQTATADIEAKVEPSDATDGRVSWKSDDVAVATVSSIGWAIGRVYAKKPGEVRITASARDGSGKFDSCVVKVVPEVYIKTITLNRNELVLYRGNSYTLTHDFYPNTASYKRVKWSSDNESIVNVDADGMIHANGPGTATIIAKAEDGSGVQACCHVTVKQTSSVSTEENPDNKATESIVADPIDAYTGAHLLKNTLMTLFGGQCISLSAHYNSTNLSVGTLGAGWYHNYEKRLEVSGNEAYVYSSPSQFSKYVAQDECCNTFTCVTPGKNNFVLTTNNFGDYPYIICCNVQRTEYYDTQGRLAKVTDHQGFETLITYTDSLCTITDTVSGKKMHLEKDDTGKIARVYDEAGREATLEYDGNLLIKICDINGNSLSYTYDEEGKVLTGNDAKGVCYFKNTYDDYGRVITQQDAIEGHRASTFVYDGDTRITTNREGKTSIRVYNENGLLIRYTDECGNTKSYVYDEHHNIVRETDACENTVTKLYNEFNKPFQIVNKNGNVTDFIYDTEGNLIKITYPMVEGEIPVETFTYNTRNQLIEHCDLRGTTTTYSYDANSMPLSKKVGDRTAIQYTYQNGLLVSQIDALGNTTEYAYNTIGQMVCKTDADGNETHYEYDAAGNLLKATDAEDGSVIYTYDGNYQKTSVTDARGNKTEYTYNGNMKNETVTLPDGNIITYRFDGEDRLIAAIDQAGNISTISYDDSGRAISKRSADGASIGYEYDAVGRVVKETKPTGAITLKTYDAVGNLLSVTDHAGNTTRYFYNAFSKLVRSINAMSGVTEYTYSLAGDLLSETDALGNRKVYTYDAYGNRLTATDALGNVTSYTYDANNHLLTVKNALGHITTNTYNALGQLISTTDAAGHTVRYSYDALGRRTTITDARGSVFTTYYDACGNVVKTTDAQGNTVSETSYNELNLPTQITNAAGKITAYTYTSLGKVESVTDPMGHRTEYFYDVCGRNAAVCDASEHMSMMRYDMLGNVTALSGPLHGGTEYTYDTMGRLISETTVSGGVRTYSYNALNVKDEITNAKGDKKKLFYDAAGRLTGYTTPEDTVSYEYDANGNVLTVTDSHGTITRSYDAINRVSSYTDTYDNTIRYAYDAVGNLSRLIYPDGTAVTYTYDANHNLLTVTDWAGRVTAYTYDPNNRVTMVTKPDGSVTTTVYDNKQRMISTVDKTASGTVITGFEYTYDDLSRIIEEKVLANSTKMCYTYDELSRVTKRTTMTLDGTVLAEETYSHDAAGNIVGDTENTSYAYDKNNRLIFFDGKAVAYDLDGNMLSDGKTDFVYDSSNRLLSTDGISYTYNAENVRIRKKNGGKETFYTYNTNCRLSQLLWVREGETVTKYVYGRGLIGEEVQGYFSTYHFDLRGSTVAVTDECGCISDTFIYDTYGKLISGTGTSNVIFGYNGRDGVVTDENGLIYMRARYYSPEMKRFINADIVAGKLSNAITLNRFAYANGNPVSFIDPFGLSADYRSASAENIKCNQAVLVTRFDNAGLKVVGHTQLYFLGDNGVWYCAEFTPSGGENVKEKKSNAEVFWKVRTPPVYDNGTFKDVEGSNYIVLNGNFNQSVVLAMQYAKKDPNENNKEFGRYNFLFHNCADYTNELLDVADIDGMVSQSLSEGNYLISIPALREIELSVAGTIDSIPKAITDGMITIGQNISGVNTAGDIAGGLLALSGNFIDETLDFAGDVIDAGTSLIGEGVDLAKQGLAVVTNAIADGATKAWDWISFWD